MNTESGGLILVENVDSIVDWPRNFALSPNEDYLLVAHQNSNSIVCFKRDKQTGMLEYSSQVKAPNPVCILF